SLSATLPISEDAARPVNDAATCSARHSLVYSSTSVSQRSGLPDAVRSATKSYAQSSLNERGRPVDAAVGRSRPRLLGEWLCGSIQWPRPPSPRPRSPRRGFCVQQQLGDQLLEAGDLDLESPDLARLIGLGGAEAEPPAVVGGLAEAGLAVDIRHGQPL